MLILEQYNLQNVFYIIRFKNSGLTGQLESKEDFKFIDKIQHMKIPYYDVQDIDLSQMRKKIFDELASSRACCASRLILISSAFLRSSLRWSCSRRKVRNSLRRRPEAYASSKTA